MISDGSFERSGTKEVNVQMIDGSPEAMISPASP